MSIKKPSDSLICVTCDGCLPYTAPELINKKDLTDWLAAYSSILLVPVVMVSIINRGSAAFKAASASVAAWIT
jgi:hypothetical protein